MPTSTCDTASINFFSQDDECSRAAQKLFSDINIDSTIESLFSGDCPLQFKTYVNACQELFDDEVNIIL